MMTVLFCSSKVTAKINANSYSKKCISTCDLLKFISNFSLFRLTGVVHFLDYSKCFENRAFSWTLYLAIHSLMFDI